MTQSRLHRVLRIVSLVLLGVLLLGCTKTPTPAPEPTPGPDPTPTPTPTPTPEPTEQLTVRNYSNDEEDATVQMGENTIYVKSDLSSTYKGFDEEKGIISFGDSELFDKLEIKAGDILYSTERTEEFPDGYCFRVTEVKSPTKYGAGDAVNDIYVTPENVLEAIDVLDEKVKLDWDSFDSSCLQVYDVITAPDLEEIGEAILGDDAFEKRSIGNGVSVTPGIRKSELEYVIWEDTGEYKPWEGEVKHADMKLVLTATIDHDFVDGIEVQFDHGKLLMDTDFATGVSLNLTFYIDGKHMNQEEMSKEERKAFLKQFEKTGERILGRQIKIFTCKLKTAPSDIIANPKFEIIWEFRVEKISGEFSLTVGYVGAKYNLHIENKGAWSTELVRDPIRCISEPHWVFDVDGHLEGTLAMGPGIGVTVEFPLLRYSGEYKQARNWKNYRGKTIPAFAGAYLEGLLEGNFKLSTHYNVLTGKFITDVVLKSKFRIDVVAEYLIGFSKLLVGYDQLRATPISWDLGDFEYRIIETDAAEYCIAPEIGSYLPEVEPVYFEWKNAREDADSFLYEIYAGQDKSSLQLLASGLDHSWYRTEKPLKYGTWYWKVVSYNPSSERYEGNKFESEVWHFTVGEEPGGISMLVPVDLGLPSQVSWADRNLGADHSYDAGDYFSWGSTTAISPNASSVYWNNYPWSNGDGSSFSKYNLSDMITVLDKSDDAAVANEERTGWRMPTKEEWQELRDKCDWTLSEREGVPGYIITNPDTGAYIFIPVQKAYYGQNGKGYSDGALYWTASRELFNNVSLASAVQIGGTGTYVLKSTPRYEGLMIRPVFTGNAAPAVSVDKTSVNFQEVAIGTSKTEYITVTNVGYSTLYLTMASITDPFTCEKLMETFAVEPTKSHVFKVVFSPTDVKDYEGKAIISSNAPGSAIVVNLTGSGIVNSDGGIDDIPGENL